MARTRFIKENRYHRALSEVTEDELVLAIVKGQHDAGACRQELLSRGWTELHIQARMGDFRNRK